MIPINIICNDDGYWPDLANNPNLIDLRKSQLSLALLKGGMLSGLPSVMLRIDLPNGQIIITETSLALLSNAIKIFNTHLKDRN